MYTLEQSLNGKWALYIAENRTYRAMSTVFETEAALQTTDFLRIDGSVPGNFELDLQAAGKLEDPYFGTNSLSVQRLENRHLWYVRRFTFAGEAERAWLHFEGIDTFSEIYLNGKKLGETDNMFLPHEFRADGIRQGENELLVHILPTVIEARKFAFDADVHIHQPYNAASLTVRKAAHSFGWDIFPRFVSGGIWRGCSVVVKKPDFIDDVYLATVSLGEDKATLHCLYSLALDGDFAQDYSLKISGECGESRFSHRLNRLWHNRGCFDLELPNPKLWWPRDMGEPSLYRVTAELSYLGEVVDTKTFDFGVRTVKLLRTETTDSNGSGEFCFVVNGEKCYVRGANWVPLDAFHSKDAERLDGALQLLWDANCNMVRVWGGGVYEDHPFYDFCDRRGILVWQDFMMGCAAYPQNEAFLRSMEREVETIVRRLRQHPSIALWAGDNECDCAAMFWGAVRGDPAHATVTRVTIPNALRRVDPWREYLPSSPYIGREVFETGDLSKMPEDHLWGPRGYYKAPYYVNTNAHFVSEMGAFGCPSVQSLEKFLPADALSDRTHDAWQLHSTAMETGEDVPYAFRRNLIPSLIEILFGSVPDDLERYVRLSRFYHGEAFKFAIEFWRTHKWRRTGLIWWNLLDGWPQTSEALADYYFDRKLAFTYVRRSQEPLCLMLREPRDGKLEIVIANEFLTEKQAHFRVIDLKTDECLAEGNTAVAANDLSVVGAIDFVPQGNRYYLLELDCEGVHRINHYVSGGIPFAAEEYERLLQKAGIL